MKTYNDLHTLIETIFKPLGFNKDEIYTIYTCYVYAYGRGKFLPGHRLIYLVYKLASLLMIKGDQSSES